MLANLMKYEIKGTARLFIPLYLALLLFALLNRIINPFGMIESSENFNLQVMFSIISITVYFILIVGIFVMTLIIMIQRFYKNLLGDEGYLMFTLPVKSWQHIVSKLLVSMLWTILSFIMAICSILILVDSDNLFKEIRQLISRFTDIFGSAGFFTLPYYALLSLTTGILMIYAAIALGHLFSKHKLMASFGMYCVLYVIYQVVMVLFILVFGKKIFTPVLSSPIPTPSDINTLVFSFSIPTILIMAANFILTNYILQKKLNLE
ncbi:MAG TPA: ABC transporter permease [Clostridiaceae bacterium]|nr:ABC transporter permease [Clostridiaceae bacterium]